MPRPSDQEDADNRWVRTIAAAARAVTSALVGGMISLAEAATIAAELAMPDLDLIKQAEQDRRGRFARGRSGNPAGRPRGWWSTPSLGRSRPATSSGVCSLSRLVRLMQFIGLRWPK